MRVVHLRVVVLLVLRIGRHVRIEPQTERVVGGIHHLPWHIWVHLLLPVVDVVVEIWINGGWVFWVDHRLVIVAS